VCNVIFGHQRPGGFDAWNASRIIYTPAESIECVCAQQDSAAIAAKEQSNQARSAAPIVWLVTGRI
jgi:hypothetical protein